MIKKTLFIVAIILGAGFLFYLSLPAPTFPTPISGSLRSVEPGDNETPLRQAYYTNSTREEVMASYIKQFKEPTFLNLPFFTEELNYPPEEAQTVIRDQTKGTFLEELVHPFRESIYINGFEPKDGEVILEVNKVRYRQKVTVKYIPTSIYVRVAMGISIMVLLLVLLNEYKNIRKK